MHLAESGFAVTPTLARSLSGTLRSFQRYPASVAAYSKNGVAYEAGELLKQPDLARTLARIMLEGRDGFYRGETARLIAEEMRRGGGMITEEDLAKYEAKERAPIRGTYRGYDVIGMAKLDNRLVAVERAVIEDARLDGREPGCDRVVRLAQPIQRLAQLAPGAERHRASVGEAQVAEEPAGVRRPRQHAERRGIRKPAGERDQP